MTLYDKILLLADALGVITFIVMAAVLLRRNLEIHSAGKFFAFWALAFLFEYYFLGENSYIHMDDQGDHFPPYFFYLLNQHMGGQFGHEIGGGTDVYTALSPGLQLISPELLWFSVFPVWIAILIHKVIVVSVGFWGAYLLCRNATGADVLTSAAAGALFTVSTHNLIFITYSIGAGLAYLPLAIYVFVVRSDEHHYWRYAIPMAIVSAIYLDVTHVVEPVFAGIGLAALMLKRINLRVVLSLVILFAAVLVNWGEPLYAMLQTAPLTDRGGNIDLDPPSRERITLAVQALFVRASENRITLLAIAALAILWLRRDENRLRWTIGIAALFALYLFLILFPFQKVGMGAFSKLSHHYVLLAITALTLLPLVRAVNPLPFPVGWHMGNYKGSGGAIILALAIGMLVQFKAYNLANLLYHGGQSQYTTIGAAADKSWRPSEPFRVITLRVRDLGPEPALAGGFYGLEIFDMFMMLEAKERSAYYETGIMRQKATGGGADHRLMVDWSRWRDGKYRGIGEQVSLPLLRVANVGFILSPLPLEERKDGVRQVDGPSTPPMTRQDREARPLDYLTQRVRRLFDFNDLYIYSLPNPYPLVYAPDRIISVPDGLSDGEFIKIVEKLSSGPGFPAAVRAAETTVLGKQRPNLRITEFEKIRDGYTARLDAPDGGVVVVNTIAVPFWTATADGKPLDIVPVNHIQMAVAVQPGTKIVKFAYHRPTVADALGRFVP